MRMGIFIVVGVVTLLTGCSRGPVITIRNASPLTLSNVVVSGAGFSERIGSLSAGAQHRFTARPSGESGLRVAFDGDGRHIETGPQGYFEAGGGYRVAATVNGNLTVSVASELSSY